MVCVEKCPKNKGVTQYIYNNIKKIQALIPTDLVGKLCLFVTELPENSK